MPKALVPIAAILLIFTAPFFNYRGTNTESKHLWMTVFTYDLPENTLPEGQHTYWFDLNWTTPKPGSLNGSAHALTISDSAPLRRGFALLRPSGPQTLMSGTDILFCEPVDSIHPDQKTRFMLAYVADYSLTRQEVLTHVETMDVTVRWDDQPPVHMEPRSITRSWEALWNCDPWAMAEFSSEGGGQGN